MRLKNVLKTLLVLFILTVICIIVINYIIRTKEKEGYKYTYIWNSIEELENGRLQLNDVNDVGIVEIMDLVLYDKTLWNKLPLSENFKQKFKLPKSIIKKYDNYNHISSGKSYDFEKNNVVSIYCAERENIISMITGKNISTEYYFEYIIDKNNQLDDLILLKEVDIDSMTAETYSVREYDS